jgi:hypothetical protein
MKRFERSLSDVRDSDTSWTVITFSSGNKKNRKVNGKQPSITASLSLFVRKRDIVNLE